MTKFEKEIVLSSYLEFTQHSRPQDMRNAISLEQGIGWKVFSPHYFACFEYRAVFKLSIIERRELGGSKEFFKNPNRNPTNLIRFEK